MAILDDILARKKADLAARQERISLARLQEQVQRVTPPRDFIGALKRPAGTPVKILAEIKAASPTEGRIREDFDPAELAERFEEAGAAAISVLTEEHFFGGDDEHLITVSTTSSLPVLRKDFTISEYQIWEARTLRADAVLLMAQILSLSEIESFMRLTHELGMTALVESHTVSDLEKALISGARLIGINNRDFVSLTTDLGTTERLRGLVPSDRVLVSQSGIHTKEDMRRLSALNVDAVQIGTSIMHQGDVAGFIAELMEGA